MRVNEDTHSSPAHSKTAVKSGDQRQRSATPVPVATASRDSIRRQVMNWYATNARALPWRASGVSPWGVLVSEVMSQQTPAARVSAPWRHWMERWPTPADLARARTEDVLRAWGRLGYPRRALRLAETARVLAEQGNEVPDTEPALLALPGVGRYTAAAVLAFAFRRRSLVLDVNIRRVLARLIAGQACAAPTETAAERTRAVEWLPEDDSECAAWSQAVMELGAVLCVARKPACASCPVREHCRWVQGGSPAWNGPARAAQAWTGTDRQCRGRIMAALRESDQGVLPMDLVWHDSEQLDRCVAGLIADGLAHRTGERLRLG